LQGTDLWAELSNTTGGFCRRCSALFLIYNGPLLLRVGMYCEAVIPDSFFHMASCVCGVMLTPRIVLLNCCEKRI